MVAAHYDSIEKCLRSVAPLMKHPLFTCEMMDKIILDCTKNNLTQAKNRFFLKGDPKGILMLELRASSKQELQNELNSLIDTLEEINLSYDFSILKGDEIQSALYLRSAGLGLLGNIVGDKKAVACIEDTAVPVEQLADYIEEFTALPMLLLLDEPFSEVHYDLKKQLIHHIPSSFYVVYTSTQQDEISNLNKAQIYGINEGSLCKI